MAEQQRTDEATQEQTGIGPTIRRRGILAAAGAVVAGMVAKQTSEPVAAYSGGGDQGPLNLGSNPWYIAGSPATNTAAGSSAPTVLQASVNYGNFLGTNGADPVVFEVDATSAASGSIIAIIARGKGDGDGVVGTSDSGPGVAGTSSSSYGVFGHSVSGKGVAGSSSSNSGVDGGSGSGYGVYGNSSSNAGVFGFSSSNTGVYGNSGSGTGVVGYSNGSHGVYGTTYGTGLVAGLYGTSSTAYGIIGNTTASGYSGLTAITGTAGVAALAATATVSSAFAAYFSGFTYVQGNFAVSGNKSAAVMHPDGTRRLFYCTEAPEAWFEDYGKATLVNGKAEVSLDPEFALFIETGDYHVFLTSHDPASRGLALATVRPDGFTVQEHAGGASNGTFSYRVVAKRKDNPGKRLEKFAPIKVNIPDPDKLPKPEHLTQPVVPKQP
ncbi:MAG: hypothetical protein LC793_17950 [Thermomicrobia bacterium]|nr:hypothetical protein [Thermomicrobia bacterium]